MDSKAFDSKKKERKENRGEGGVKEKKPQSERNEKVRGGDMAPGTKGGGWR